MPAVPGAIPAPNQFDVQRTKTAQRFGAQTQQQGDAIKRRFASLGSLNSGSAIKAQELAAEKNNQALQDANAEIDAAQNADQARKDEIKAGQDFQAGEAEKNRAFTKEQSAGDRAFQEKVFAFDSSSKLRALDQADQAFGLQKDESEFNKKMAKWQQDNSGGFFGAGGFLGTGL